MSTYMLRFTLILVKVIGYLVLSLCDILSFSQYKGAKSYHSTKYLHTKFVNKHKNITC